ncbi:MAG TPA: hypothetical protein PK840_07970 [Bacilli bacterium]|nr:hypothetical protein [Bacilli bacterium]
MKKLRTWETRGKISARFLEKATDPDFITSEDAYLIAILFVNITFILLFIILK